MFEVERHREGFLRAVGLWEREKDGPTFEPYNEKDIGEGFTLTQYAFDRIERAIAILDEVFAARTLEQWRTILDDHGVWYEVVQDREEFLADDVARDTGAIVENPETGARVLATPIELEDMDRDNLFRPPPALGQHTGEVLEDLGLSDKERQTVLREIEQDAS
jgi:crotonobetainyl-CoA:carnitine CoA-transferase CaiB-like acyl-CoA transferase